MCRRQALFLSLIITTVTWVAGCGTLTPSEQLAEKEVEETPSALVEAADEGNRKVVDLLLKAGVDPNASGDNDQTPLSAAVAGGHSEVVHLLLEHGAEDPPRTMNRASSTRPRGTDTETSFDICWNTGTPQTRLANSV